MPYRFIPFINEQAYHIFNRGTEKRRVFDGARDYQRFIKTLRYYQADGPKPRLSHFLRKSLFKPDFSKKIVEILAYCLMPNHFHLLVKQLREDGIRELVSKLTNSYTKYYNTKYTRVGPLFQGEFKAVLIENDEQLIHVSRYIHLNPLASFLVKNLNQYDWSSYNEYRLTSDGICTKDQVLSFFKSPQDYERFVLDQASYAQELELIKHQVIEEE